PESGKFETLYDACDGRRLRGPNDLVFDRAGGFWFTDLGKTRERDSDRGAVYYAQADGSRITEAIFPLERPNGIGLSPDERTLYVVETPTARCWAFRLSAPGQIESANGPYRGEKGRVVVGLGGYQMFDSLAVDAEGHVAVATLVTGAVSDIWPDGSRVDQYALPDMMVTNVCFGGPEVLGEPGRDEVGEAASTTAHGAAVARGQQERAKRHQGRRHVGCRADDGPGAAQPDLPQHGHHAEAERRAQRQQELSRRDADA